MMLHSNICCIQEEGCPFKKDGGCVVRNIAGELNPARSNYSDQYFFFYVMLEE